MSEAPAKKSLTMRFLDGVERVCKKLPPPAILFCLLFLITAVVAWLCTIGNVSVVNPANGKAVVAQNLFSEKGLEWLLTNLTKNFTGYAPMGLVMCMTLTIGLCDESGLLMALIQKYLRNVPPSLMAYVVGFIGVMGNIASNTAYVVVPPLAAVAFLGVGKNPIAGMIASYAGCSAGFTANMLIAGTDSLVAGLTNDAIKGFLGAESTFHVDVTCNWYFMMASTVLCALVIGWVSNHIVEPRLGKYEGDADTSGVQDLTPEQKLGLKRAGLGSLVFIAVILVLYFWGPLGLTKSGARKFIGSAFLNGLIPILFFFFAVPGILYGYTVGTFKSSADINKAMVRQTAAVGSFVVLCFFAGQFQGLFNWTKLGTILAIEGANFLKGIGFTGIPMCVCFIFVAGCINILISSSAAKWAILAPLFVPMFMLMGYHPGFTQLLYRLGDSPSNCISPLSAYVWMMLSVVQAKYNKDAHIGIMLSNLVPYFVALQIIWVTFFIIWAYAGLPIGPGVTMQMPAGILP